LIQYIDAKASPVGNVTLDRIFGAPPCPHYHGWVPTAEERAGNYRSLLPHPLVRGRGGGMSYVTPAEASERLRAHGFEGVPLQGHLDLASQRLDAKGPYVAGRLGESQALAFPRTYNFSLPDAPPVTSEPIPTIGAIQYARPARSQVERLQDGLLNRYFRRVGSLG
jgi:hypothetical protein